MTLRFRRKLFVFFIFLFVLISIGTVYYTNGYRFDFQSLKLVRTGSLYVESYEHSLSIHVNEKVYQDKSGLLKKGTLVSSLLPKKYTVRIEKDGFLSYEKNVEIRSLQVSRLFHVFLLPEEFFASASIPIPSIAGKVTTLVDTDISNRLLVTSAKGLYSLIDTTSPTKSIALKPYIASLTKNTFDGFYFRPGATHALLGYQSDSAHAFDMDSDTITPLIEGDFLKSYHNKDYFYGSASTSILIYNVRLGTREDLFGVPFATKEISSIDGVNGQHAFLLSNGDIWVRQNGNFEKIAHNATYVSFSPDGYKILFQDSGGAVFVHLLRDEYEVLDTAQKTTYRVELTNAKLIKDIAWYSDSYHICIGYGNRILLAEIMRSEPNNQVLLWSGAYDSFLYEPTAKSLFVLHQNTIELFDFSKW